MFGVHVCVMHTCSTVRTRGVTRASDRSFMVGWPTKQCCLVARHRQCGAPCCFLTHRGSAEHGGAALAKRRGGGFVIGPALQGARQARVTSRSNTFPGFITIHSPLRYRQQLADAGCFRAVNL